MTTEQLTPSADTTPAVVSIPERELSGAVWVQRFPGSANTGDLEDGFRQSVDRFVNAMRSSGMGVAISATHRPEERAYLMHWCWMVAKERVAPNDVPTYEGVNIQWDHGDDPASISAAKAMVNGYGMSGLNVAPALRSRHTERRAIDMTISWAAQSIAIAGADGQLVTIATTPRSGMNSDLQTVGRGYGVIKFVGGASDKPHWSTDGH